MSGGSGHSFAQSQGSYLTAPAEEESPAEDVSAVALYDFTASSPFELSVAGERMIPRVVVSTDGGALNLAGTPLRIVEPDDGSGWIKVADGKGSGLVPVAYVKEQAESAPSPTSRGGSGAQGKLGRIFILSLRNILIC